ncbi:hypothetical protein EIP91_008052 [Steccherinum ochraceum]|uniref:Uncharacterized protein n=1 Tax=Steccherinum ochraceum TaxID=92696 RepID=A0A4V2MXA1_9APHY|nr:hypothetical protein EIP91_008052 [Steccherinum ochraceum]
MSKHFCCCIPVRAAVFFFSLLSLLVAGATAAFAWFILYEIDNDKVVGDFNFGSVNNTGKIAFIVTGAVFTLAALISLFGFVGAVFRKRRLVKSYSFFTWIIFLLSCAATGFFFYALYSGKNIFNGCQFTDSDGTVHECKLSLPTWQKVVATAAAVVTLFIQLYIAIVIGRYVEQLYDEHDEHSLGSYKLAKNVGASNSTYEPTYYPPTAQDSHQGLLNQGHSYPYTDSAHAFGSHA